MRRSVVPQAPPAQPKTRGRKRSETSREAILSATLHILKEVPLRDLTIEEIARRAGVGKATIYKWWSSKACVALDAYSDNIARLVPTPDTGSAENDFKIQLNALFRFYASPSGKLFTQFLAEGQSDPEFARLFRERFVGPRREVVGVIFDRAVQRGEIGPNLDRELVLDMIYGPAIYRLMARHAPLERDIADALISTLFRGLRDKSLTMKRAIRRAAQSATRP
jgi:AcrR family transcriptional regulator